MGRTIPLWLQITAAAILFAPIVRFVVWTVVLWVVRLRFPGEDVLPRLIPRGGDDAELRVIALVRPVTGETVVPSAHQPAARRPAWHAPAGPRPSDGTAVRFRMTPQAGRRPPVRLNVAGSFK
jgi:hypothetical protein